MPRLTIDNREVEVDNGATILDAAEKLGIEIPTMCFLKEYKASTSCMICVVKIEDMDNLSDTKCEKPFTPIFLSSNAITLSDRIQIVIRFYGDPEEIHKNFDFVHCTNYWLSWNNSLETSDKALESLLAKELYYMGSKYPICSVIRTRKFLRKGWHINAGQYLKMAFLRRGA